MPAAIEDREPALALTLGDVHRDIGLTHERLAGVRAAGAKADADAAARGPVLAGDPHRRSDRLEQPLGQGARIGLGRASLDQDRELVAAEPGDRISGADAAAQGIGNRYKHLVARMVAMVVVDRLEVVEVEEEGRNALVALGERMLKP